MKMQPLTRIGQPSSLSWLCLLAVFGLSAEAANYTWDTAAGDSAITDGGGTWTAAAGNWFNGTSYDRSWANGNGAIFGGGTAGTAGTVTLGGAITATNLIFTPPNAGNYIIDTASFGLTLNSPAIITNNESATIQSGAGGSLALGAAATVGVVAGKTLTINSPVSGAFALTKSGAGMLALSGANSYSGGTVNTAGRIRLGADNVLGSGVVTMSGGVMSADGTTARTLANTLQVTVNTTFGDLTDTGTLTNTGPVTTSGTGKTLTFNSDAMFAGGFTNGAGNGSVKTGPGTLTLKGAVDLNAAANWTFDTTQGTLMLDGATVAIRGRLSLNAAAGTVARLVITNGATVSQNDVGANERVNVPNSGTGINYYYLAGTYSLPSASTANGKLIFNNTAALTEFNLLAGGDTTVIAVTNDGASTGITRFNFNGGTLRAKGNNSSFFQGLTEAKVQAGGANIDTSTFDIAIAQSLLAGSPSGGLTKLGAGTLTLAGANTYSGTTLVSAGNLVVSSAQSGGGAFSVSDGASLSVVRDGTTTSLMASSLTIGSALGATISFKLPTGNPAGAVITAGTLTLNGTNQIEILGTNFTVGQFPLIKYTGKSGTGSFVALSSGDLIASVSNNVANSSIDLVVSSTAPLPNVELSVSPDFVFLTNSAQPVTLSWTAVNVPSNATYTISASQPVSFPGGNGSGTATNGTTTIQALVNGTLGSTVFTLNLFDAVPKLVASATATVTQIPTPSTNTSRPNILVILYDDTGWGDFGCYGSAIRTPNIDALAAGGLRFREFYNSARCAPTRAALITGNYHQEVVVTPTAALPPLRTDNNITIAELLGSTGSLGANGYHTYKAGKWHLGTTAPQRPTSRGFEHNFGQGIYGDGVGVSDRVFGMWIETDFNLLSADNAGLTNPYDSEIPLRAYAPTKQFHYSDAIGDYCVDYINNCFLTHHDGRPCFIYMPFNAPHFPVSAPAAMANNYTAVGDPNPNHSHVIQYEAGWDVIRQQTYERQLAMGVLKPGTALSPKSGSPTPSGDATQQPIDDWNTLSQAQRDDLARREAIFAAAVELDDQNIGKVVNRLKELGQFDNTLIFVLCDNGANWEGGEFGNSDSSTFTPWATADLPAMGQPQSAYDALGIAYNKYPYINQGAAWANLSNVPFRLYKHFDHNGGIRTPLVVSWPAGMANSVKGTWTDERGHIIDIMATIADITGASYPANFGGHAVSPMQGISLKPTFSGAKLRPRDLGFEHEKNRAYYRGNWKLVTKNFAFSDGSSPASQLELYDMTVDPTELTNQAINQPVVLANLVDAWNAWDANVGLPTTTTYLLTPINPPQISPAPFANDLFVDNFNRAASSNLDASTNGMSGSRFVAVGAGANVYYEGYETAGVGSICVSNNGLRMCVGGGTCENGLQYNFNGSDITVAGGFSVQMRIDDINAFTPDTDCYAGFAVGLTQAQAASGADIASPGSFRGNGVNRGVAPCFVELDQLGNVKLWTNGVLVASVPVGKNSGTLLASFETTSFAAGSSVTVTVFLDGQPVNLNPGGTNMTETFTWQTSEANYIGLSARVTAPVASYVKLDNLAVRTYPLAYALASEYAMSAGLNAPTNAPDADPYGTGDNNLVEWLKGSKPGVNDSRQLLMLGPTTQGEFRFDHFELVNAAAYGVSYRFLYSTDLVHWSSFTPETISTVPDVPGYQLVESRVPTVIAAGQNQMFIRIFERIDSSSTLPASLMVAPSAPMSQTAPSSTPPED